MALSDPESRSVRGEQLRELSDEELRAELAKLREARFRLTFRSATEAIENTAQIRVLRRNIARIRTVLRERAT